MSLRAVQGHVGEIYELKGFAESKDGFGLHRVQRVGLGQRSYCKGRGDVFFWPRLTNTPVTILARGVGTRGSVTVIHLE